MRIIAGQFRGRKLKGPGGANLRPTSDRLRETLFNILGPAVRDSVLVDVFAGTGAIGLEALSRGAREVVFVESSPESCRLIRHNLELCGITSGYRLLPHDAFTAMRSLARERFTSDTVFLDPPYDWQPYGDLLDVTFRSGIAHAGSRVVFEHHRKAQLPESGEKYRRVRTLRQGDTCLSFYEMGTGHFFSDPRGHSCSSR